MPSWLPRPGGSLLVEGGSTQVSKLVVTGVFPSSPGLVHEVCRIVVRRYLVSTASSRFQPCLHCQHLQLDMFHWTRSPGSPGNFYTEPLHSVPTRSFPTTCVSSLKKMGHRSIQVAQRQCQFKQFVWSSSLQEQ